MTTDTNRQPPLTLLQEFQASYRAGPRAWRCVGLFFAVVCLSPLVAWWAVPLAILFFLPAFVGATLGRWVARVRDAHVMRQLQSPPR